MKQHDNLSSSAINSHGFGGISVAIAPEQSFVRIHDFTA